MTITQARKSLESIKDAVASAEAVLTEIETLPPDKASNFTSEMLKIITALNSMPQS